MEILWFICGVWIGALMTCRVNDIPFMEFLRKIDEGPTSSDTL